MTNKKAIELNWLNAISLIALVWVLTASTSQAQSIWNGTGTPASWNDNTATGWNGTGVPSAIDQTATVNTNITANSIMNLNVSAILGSFTIGDSSGSQTWTVQDTGTLGTSLTFDVSSGSASLTTNGSGTNAISVPITLNDNLALSNATQLTLSGIIAGTGNGISKSGTGNLILSGTGANTYSGLTTVTAGTLTLNKTAAGTTAVAGNIQVDGGTLILAQSNQIADAATVTLNSGATGFTINVDKAETVAGVVVHGGTLNMVSGSTTNTSLTTTTTTIDGGSITLGRGQYTSPTLSVGGTGTITLTSPNANGSTMTTTNLTINQPASGAYTPITLTANSTGEARFALSNTTANTVTFVGDAGNTNSVTIEANGAGAGAKNMLMSGNTTFDIGNGGAAVDLIIKPNITSSGARSLTKTGSGTMQLNGINTYSGATVVNGGTLLVASSATINGTSGVTVTTGILDYQGTTGLTKNVTVNGGTFKNNGGNYTGTLTFTSGTLGGTNLGNINLTGGNAIGTGKVLSPGNSPGTLTTGNVNFVDGGIYLWEINDLSLAQGGSAGTVGGDPGWDWVNGGANTLDLSAITTGAFTLQLDSLNALTGWNPTSGSYQWTIASFASITGFQATDFLIDTTGFSENANSGSSLFSVTSDGVNLYLNYAAVIPEPSTYALLFAGLTALWVLRRKSKGSLS